MLELLFNDLRIDKNTFNNLNFKDLIFLCDLYGSTNLKQLKKVVGNFDENNSPTND